MEIEIIQSKKIENIWVVMLKISTYRAKNRYLSTYMRYTSPELYTHEIEKLFDVSYYPHFQYKFSSITQAQKHYNEIIELLKPNDLFPSKIKFT